MRGKLILIVSFILWGVVTAEGRRGPMDSNYVQDFPGTFTLRTYLGEKVSVFDLADRASGRDIAYRPNTILGLGVGITIHGIGINFSTRLPFHDTKIDKYGRTQRYDIQVHRYRRKVMLDAYFQRYTGFHLGEKTDVTQITGPQEYPYFPNLRATIIGATGLYVFNGEKYSMRGMTTQQDWQLKSAGSPLLGASVFTHFFDDDSSVLPAYYRYGDFFGGRHPQQIHYYGLTVNGGYGYTVVLDKASHYFLAGAVDVGAGPGYSTVKDVTGEELSHVTFSVAGNVRVGVGYNSLKWYAGLYSIFHADSYQLPYSESSLRSGQGIIRLVVARRLVTGNKLLGQPAD